MFNVYDESNTGCHLCGTVSSERFCVVNFADFAVVAETAECVTEDLKPEVWNSPTDKKILHSVLPALELKLNNGGIYGGHHKMYSSVNSFPCFESCEKIASTLSKDMYTSRNLKCVTRVSINNKLYCESSF